MVLHIYKEVQNSSPLKGRSTDDQKLMLSYCKLRERELYFPCHYGNYISRSFRKLILQARTDNLTLWIGNECTVIHHFELLGLIIRHELCMATNCWLWISQILHFFFCSDPGLVLYYFELFDCSCHDLLDSILACEPRLINFSSRFSQCSSYL